MSVNAGMKCDETAQRGLETPCENGNFTPLSSIASVTQRRTYFEVCEMIPSSCSRSGSSKLLLFKFFTLAAFIAGMAVLSKAQDKVELFGGYSYFRASIRETQFSPCLAVCLPPGALVTQTSENANLNGWEFSGQYKFLPFLGGAVDFNGTYGKLHGAGTREHTYLVGPQVSIPFKISPFAHALFGVARESQDTIPAACPVTIPTCSGFATLGSDTSWASAVGGGLDWHVAPFVAVRAFQLDYIHTHLHGASQNQPRVSAGIVFHF